LLDAGRVSRPLLIVEKDGHGDCKLVLNTAHIEALKTEVRLLTDAFDLMLTRDSANELE
jgi:hypothetical protein